MMRPDLKVFKAFLKAQDSLKVYTPKDFVITSEKEIKYISDLLELDLMTAEEMEIMRGFVVLYYEHLRTGLSTDDRLWLQYWNSMLSVTAVIDYLGDRKD